MLSGVKEGPDGVLDPPARYSAQRRVELGEAVGRAVGGEAGQQSGTHRAHVECRRAHQLLRPLEAIPFDANSAQYRFQISTNSIPIRFQFDFT